MAGEQCERHIELAEDGKIRAAAEVTPMDQSVIRASLHADAGHLPVGTRTRLVDAVLDLPETAGHDRLEATVPLGDAESIARLRERCDKVATRPAGATCLVDADLPAAEQGQETDIEAVRPEEGFRNQALTE